MFRQLKILSCTFGILLSIACSPYTVKKAKLPFDIEKIKIKKEDIKNNKSLLWYSYEDENINYIISRVLSSNLDLKAAWARLAQAKSIVWEVNASYFPYIDLNNQIQRDRADGRTIFRAEGVLPGADTVVYNSTFNSHLGLSYEVDLWKKIDSSKKAASLRAEASKANLEATAIMLVSSAIDLWFQIIEQSKLVKSINNQVENNQNLLNLTKLRFQSGNGSLFDIIRQEQQLASTNAILPRQELQLANSILALKTILGIPASEKLELDIPNNFPKLSPFSLEISAAELINTRPDLRSSKLVLEAAEFDIAKAVADRFPKLTLGLSYDLRSSNLSDLVSSQLGSFISGLNIPIFDGGKSRNFVSEKKYRRDELKAEFAKKFLSALEEVESAIISEQIQTKILDQTSQRQKLAKLVLDQSIKQYLNGLNDYRSVIDAKNSLEEIEKLEITEHRALLQSRNKIYRSIGSNLIKEKKNVKKRK